MNKLDEFNKQVESCVRRKDGATLCELLRLRSLRASAAMEEYVTKGGNLPSPLAAPWNVLPEMVKQRFQAGAALNSNDWVACSDHLSKSLQTYTTALATDTAWSVPLLQALCADVRQVAEQADDQLRSEGQKPNRLEDAERVLKRAFAVTNNDRRELDEGSRKIGTLGVINQLLKIYFRLNNLRLCGNLTRTVNAPNFPPFEKYPGPDRVTYRYFSGRLHLYDDRIAEAEKDLTYAFCNVGNSVTHKREILLYLIPAKILMGSLPKREMLVRFNMKWYVQIVRGIKTGNLRLFDEAIEEYEEFFIRRALYLALEKMRPLVYRSLCKVVIKVQDNVQTSAHKIRLETLRVALRLYGTDMTRDEIECIMANLIFNRYIKGYLSHKVGVVVLSKKNPFPPLQV